MKHFIDFGIKIETIKTKNILGEFIETTEFYYIYKCWFWGLFKKYLKFSPTIVGKIEDIVYVNYVEDWRATKFYTVYDCNNLIEDIKKNPNKYVLNNYLYY